MKKTVRITLELSGKTLENLLFLALKLQRHPNDITIDLLHAAIEASMHSTEAQLALLSRSSNGTLQ